MVNIMVNIDTTTVIAIYGAILSSTAIVWNIMRDKRSIKVSASAGFIGHQDGSESTSIYSFQAVNTGKRPITLTSVGIEIENGISSQFIDDTNLPKKLNEGDKVSFYRESSELKKELANHKPKYLWFNDTTGKIYKSKSVKKLFSLEH